MSYYYIKCEKDLKYFFTYFSPPSWEFFGNKKTINLQTWVQLVMLVESVF